MGDKIVYHKTEEDLFAEKTDVTQDGIVYAPWVTRMLLAGFFAGGILLGAAAWLIASGAWPVEGFGYIAAAGAAPAAAAGFGIGSAAGALTAGMLSINKLHRKLKD